MFVSSVILSAALASTVLASPTARWSRPCSPNVIALATGIHLNIQGQHAEYNGTVKILQIESQTPVNMEDFYIAKGQLESDVQAGMNLRFFNQQIAPPNSPALPGLAKYQAAEQTEANIAAALTGNPAQDTKPLNNLKADILAGIKLNQNNLAKATENCDFTLQFPPTNEMGSG